MLKALSMDLISSSSSARIILRSCSFFLKSCSLFKLTYPIDPTSPPILSSYWSSGAYHIQRPRVHDRRLMIKELEMCSFKNYN